MRLIDDLALILSLCDDLHRNGMEADNDNDTDSDGDSDSGSGTDDGSSMS